MNIATGPVTKELYDICILNEQYAASAHQTAMALRLSALGNAIEQIEKRAQMAEELAAAIHLELEGPIDVMGPVGFRDWFDSIWPEPKSHHQRSNWKYRCDMAYAGWIAREDKARGALAKWRGK